MKFLFRVDASLEIGTGHVVRCLTLANELKSRGHICEFVHSNFQGNLAEFIDSSGYKVHLLHAVDISSSGSSRLAHGKWLGGSQTQDAMDCQKIVAEFKPDWIVVDHYGIDYEWQDHFANHSTRIFVIDDLADRKHNCHVLMDQTFGRTDQDYISLIPENAVPLIGSKYCLLRPEFLDLRKKSLERRQQSSLRHLLITMGGVDQQNYTTQILKALDCCSFMNSVYTTVVFGPTSPHKESLIDLVGALSFSCEVKSNIKNMAAEMVAADFAIGAAGTSTWERCCMGLPSLLFVVSDNQKIIASLLHRAGIVELANLDSLDGLCTTLVDCSHRLDEMSKKSAKVTDGRGAQIVADILIEFNCLEDL